MDPEYPVGEKDPDVVTEMKDISPHLAKILFHLKDLLESTIAILQPSGTLAIYEYIGDLYEFKELATKQIRYTIFRKDVAGSSNPAGQVPIFSQIWIRASSLDESNRVIVFAHMVGQDLAVIRESINDLRTKATHFAEQNLSEGKWGQWAYASDPEMP